MTANAQRIIPILLAVVFLCVTSCGHIEIEVEETETEKITVVPETEEITEPTETTEPPELPERIPSEPDTLSLSDAPRTESIPTVCEVIPLADDTVTKIVQQTAYADTTAAIICTADFHWHFALFDDDGYISIARLSDERLFNADLVTLTPFDNVFGHSGVTVSVPTGANAMHRMYFALDCEEPLLLASTVKGTVAQDGMLIEQYTMGGILNLYRMEDGAVICYDLETLFHTAYADAAQVDVSYYNNFLYQEHHGLFDIGITAKGAIGYTDRFTAWLDGDAIRIINNADMKLPDYTYDGTQPNDDAAAREWLNVHLGTDFVLRTPIDPTTLTGDELQTYMDEAYQAGLSALAAYEISSDILYGAVVWSSDEPAYYVNGNTYSDMKNPVFPTFSAWESYMRRILSEKIADELLARHDRFISVNGALWGIMGSRGTDITMSESGAEVTSVSDTEIVYTVSVDILDPQNDLPWPVIDTVTHDFVYSKTEEGWRWTKLYVYN